MAAYVEMNVKGIEELVAGWATLTDRVRRKLLSTALRKGAKVVQSTAKSRAPVKSGKIKKSITIKVGRYKRGGPVRMRVVVIGAYRGPTSYVGPLELGHKVGGVRIWKRDREQAGSILDSRGYVHPRPFMRDAARMERANVLKIVEDQIRYGIAVEAAVGTVK